MFRGAGKYETYSAFKGQEKGLLSQRNPEQSSGNSSKRLPYQGNSPLPNGAAIRGKEE